VLLLVTGSIAAFKAAALASKLTQEGFDVRVVLSAGAKEFVDSSTFEGLTRNRVYESTFAPGDAMAHIDLARWADLTLVYPASANTLSKFAHGIAEDLVGTLFLATELPDAGMTQSSTKRYGRPWIAPAMNPTMLRHPATREALGKLAGWGCRIVESDEGRMACGEVGVGRLPEPEAMMEEVRGFFSDRSMGTETSSTKSLTGRRVAITAGGTVEPIDPVRVLTNTSTGETGVRLANALAAAGAEVTLLIAASSPFRAEASSGVHVTAFDSFSDLDRKVASTLSARFDFFLHAAAVSDYSIERVEGLDGRVLSRTQKIHSGEGLRLVLAPNPKILERVRDYAKNPEMRVISFKLSTAANRDEVDLSGYSSDWIVHNTASAVERGSERHAGEVFAREKRKGETERASYREIARFGTKKELCDSIIAILSQESKS
jgi:phosphopantothenoylcysteine decarboxylase/phosphopantothenate--cysteine ligase